MIDTDTDQRMRRYIAEQHKTIAELRRHLETLQQENQRSAKCRSLDFVRRLANKLNFGIRGLISKSRQLLESVRVARVESKDLRDKSATDLEPESDAADERVAGTLDVNELRRALVRFSNGPCSSSPVYQAVLADSQNQQ